MNMRDFKREPNDFDLDYHCPRCGHLVRGLPETKAVYHIGEGIDSRAFLIVRCPRRLCDLAFVVYDRLNERVESVYPFARTSAGDFHEAIPQPIRADFAEARRCLFAEAFKAVVVLCRRVMQAVALNRGASGKTLRDQVDALLTSGQITKSLHDAATEIRHFGNFGAHPQNDDLDDVTREDAKAILALTDDFLLDLFVRPHETQTLLAKRSTP
jgi:hypothetical protein